MLYKSGGAFEEAVFGSSSEPNLFERFGREVAEFDPDLKELIEDPYPLYPETPIGESLYRKTKQELEKLGIDTKGLIFRSAVNTKSDLRHYMDGVFHLPSVYNFPVTIDAFNLNPSAVVRLKDLWVDLFDGSHYSDYNFQNGLFKFKSGMAEWMREHGNNNGSGVLSDEPIDFRQQLILDESYGRFISFDFTDFREYAKSGRPKNHFILTPYDTADYESKRNFAKMVARYFASKVPSHKMALESD